MKKYDGLYILPESMKDDEVAKAWDAIKAEVLKAGGVIQSERTPSRRSFARTLAKKNAGHYAEITFELDPSKVDGLRKKHKLDERIFRVMVTESGGKGLQPEGAPEQDAPRGEG